MKNVLSWIGRVTKVFNIVGMACLVFAVVVVFLDVLVRFVSSKSILGTYEMTELSMIAIIFCAFAQTQMIGGHVHVSILTDKMPQRLRVGVGIATSVISIWMGVVLCMAGFVQASKYYYTGTTTGVVKIPLYPFAYLMSVGLVLFTLALVATLIQTIIGRKNAMDSQHA